MRRVSTADATGETQGKIGITQLKLVHAFLSEKYGI
jgi:hypothetical protein